MADFNKFEKKHEVTRVFKVGIIGCGGIANGKHLPALKGLADQGRVELIYFCDIIPERAEKAAKAYGVEGAKYTADYKELLACEEIEVIHVCTPNRSHCEISCAALKAGKDVLCEKPMAINAAEAKEMVETAKETGRTLSIGYQNRYRADAQYVKAEAEDGFFGDIYYARAYAIRRRAVPTWGVFLNEYEQGGGPLIDIGTHALDLTLWTMDNYKPKYCVGTTFHKLNNQTNTGNAWGDWDPEKFNVEDSAFGFIVMENGATISLESSWALNTHESIEASFAVCGDKGGADMRGGLVLNTIKHGKQVNIHPQMDAKGVAFYDGKKEQPRDVEARQFSDALENGTAPCVLPEQAYVVSQILEGIYISAKTGEPYYFNK